MLLLIEYVRFKVSTKHGGSLNVHPSGIRGSHVRTSQDEHALVQCGSQIHLFVQE